MGLHEAQHFVLLVIMFVLVVRMAFSLILGAFFLGIMFFHFRVNDTVEYPSLPYVVIKLHYSFMIIITFDEVLL